jgi:uncharacterized protein YegJ (DUF2314 family)
MILERHFSRILFLLLILSPHRLVHGAENPDMIHFQAGIFSAGPETRIDPPVITAVQKEFPRLVFCDSVEKAKEETDKNHSVVWYKRLDGENSDPPTLDELRCRGVGLTEEEKRSLSQSKSLLAIVFLYPPKSAEAEVRQADQILFSLAKHAKGFITDQTTRQYFSVASFEKHRIAAWEGDIPEVQNFVTIDAYQVADKSIRAISLGMEKFALPNLLVTDLTQGTGPSMLGLMNLAMQQMVETPEKSRPADWCKAKTLDVDIDSIKHKAYRENLVKTLLEKAERKMTLTLAPGKRDDGDPPGVILELTFSNQPGQVATERQVAAISKLFGSRDRLSRVKHNEALLAASIRAKTKLPEIRERFKKGLPLGDRLLVKGPFATQHKEKEWMWVEVRAWPEGQIDGILMSDPFDVPGLKSGAKVSVKQDDVFDYIIYHADRTMEGGETSKIIQEMEDPK